MAGFTPAYPLSHPSLPTRPKFLFRTTPPTFTVVRRPINPCFECMQPSRTDSVTLAMISSISSQAFVNPTLLPPPNTPSRHACTAHFSAKSVCLHAQRSPQRTRALISMATDDETLLHEANRSDSLRSRRLIEQYWHTAYSGSYSKLLPYFAEDAVYHDGLYPWPVVGKQKLSEFLTMTETIFPTGTRLIVDEVIADGLTASARWHAQTSNGKPAPLSHGLSWYRLSWETDQSGASNIVIKEAWEHVEPTIKFGIVIPIVSKVGAFFRSLTKRT